ncbi:MAG: hypothetical protein ACREL6_09595 [Gemmatimonadales bacterium]
MKKFHCWIPALALAIPLALGCGNEDAAPPADAAPPGTDAGVSVTDIAMGEALNADRSVVSEMDEFGPNDTIYLSVKTEGTGSAVLATTWRFEDGQVVSEDSRNINPTGDAVTEFHITKETPWPAGEYTVAVLLNGDPVGNAEYEVK